MSESLALPLPTSGPLNAEAMAQRARETAEKATAARSRSLLPGRTLPRTLPAVHKDRGLGNEAGLLRVYWKGKEALKLPPPVIPDGAVLSSLTVGLGDTLMLTDLPRAGKEQGRAVKVMSTSPHFRALMRFNPNWVEPGVEEQGLLVNAASVVRHRDCGNGHYLQRIRRAFGFEVADVPRACVVWSGQRKATRVVLHFDPGAHALWQRKTIHPRMRTLYPETRAELEKFIASEGGLEFVSVGRAPEGRPLKGVRHIETKTLAELVQVVGGSGWFIGLMSGPMHLATALQLKCIVLMDAPAGWQIMVPTLRQTGLLESEWWYVQNVHISQESEGPLVPKATYASFKRAFQNEVYPYGRGEEFARLIHEKL